MSLTRTRTRSRTLAAVGLLAATGLLLTACGPEDAASAEASSSASGSPAASGSPTGSGGTEGEGKGGADGTFSGTLSYLAPGKLLVGERAFWVAEDTEITGAGICGDPEKPGVERCTDEQLEFAAKDGNTRAEVEIKKGVAVKIFSPEGGGGAP